MNERQTPEEQESASTAINQDEPKAQRIRRGKGEKAHGCSIGQNKAQGWPLNPHQYNPHKTTNSPALTK